MVHMYFWWNHS